MMESPHWENIVDWSKDGRLDQIQMIFHYLEEKVTAQSRIRAKILSLKSAT